MPNGDDLSRIFESTIPQPDKQGKREQDFLFKKMKWQSDWQYVVHCARLITFQTDY